MIAPHVRGDAVLAGLCSAVYERDRAAREAAIRALDHECWRWIEWAGSEVACCRAADGDIDHVVMVFRGTEVSGLQVRDVLANLGVPTPWAGPGRAHGGYVRQLNRVLFRAMYDYLSPRTVVLAGHSMGGALATLFASLMSMRHGVTWDQLPPAALVTFGAPKALDRVAAAAIACPVRRYVIAGDPAPLWPPIPGLSHPGPAIHLPAPTWRWDHLPGGVWPLRHHDVDTYAEILSEAADG